MGGPVGGLVVAGIGELVRLGSVGEHGPDLARAATSGFKDNVATVGSPTGSFIAAGIASDFSGLAGSSVHDVDIVIAAGATPAEGEELAVGRPGRVDDIAHVRKIEFLGVGAVGVHEIELGNATAIANESNGIGGFGIPCGGSVGAIGGVGYALWAIAAGVGDIKSWIALHGGGKHYLGTVGRPCGRIVGAAEAGEGDELASVEGIHADLRADNATYGLETGEGNPGSIGGPARSESNRVERGELALVGSIVIHNPKFFGAVGATNESDLRGGNAGESTRKLTDDFVGELMGKFANLRVGGRAAIHFADDGLRRSAADVIHPGEDGDLGGSFGEIAEGKEIGVDRALRPVEHLEFTGLRRCFGRIKVWAGELQDAGEGEVIADDAGEENSVRLIGIRFGCEIGDGNTRPILAEAGSGAEHVLGERGGGEREEEKKRGKKLKRRGHRERKVRRERFIQRQAILQVGNGWGER